MGGVFIFVRYPGFFQSIYLEVIRRVILLSERKRVIILLVHRLHHILEIKKGLKMIKIRLRELSSRLLFVLTYQDRKKNGMSTQTSDLQSNLTLFAFSFGSGSINLDAIAIFKSGNVKIIWRAQRSPRISNKQNTQNFSYPTKITFCFLLFLVLSVSLHVDHNLSILRNLRINWTPPSASGNTTSLPAMKTNLTTFS